MTELTDTPGRSWSAWTAPHDRPLVIVHVCALVPLTVPYVAAFGGYKSTLAEEGLRWLAAAKEAASLPTLNAARRAASSPNREFQSASDWKVN
ncbi:hypothetical protein H4696_003372 [Amycolatopsis lexingtonensis]|uniref:Uncharacterized protein n=1 Tax=Amycolatopsis lexingtonensis TaxID=218822 RepID=A0ABR9HZA1_9PSEU|nr:hypothetical protein [Amycolatopsis lexingtonensis]MBE1496272.1 hypothetical protein [Amycolatopsis lexingtonensis]